MGIDPATTHNLLRLEQLLPSAIQSAFESLDLEQLTRWSSEGRYPDDLDEANSADAALAIETAAAVLAIVKARTLRHGESEA